MNRNEKDRLEYLFGMEFLNEYVPSLARLSKKYESPDIVIPSKQIGLELTQISNSGKSGFHFEGSWDSLVEAIRIKWNTLKLPACHVSLSISQGYCIPKKRINSVCDEIIELVSEYIPEQGKYYFSKDCEDRLPKYLFAFSIERMVKRDEGVISYSYGIFSPVLSPSVVQEAIRKKEFMRCHYLKKCKEIWLLIIMYGGRASGDFIINEQVINHSYLFHFDKVFLFDALPKKYWELSQLKLGRLPIDPH